MFLEWFEHRDLAYIGDMIDCQKDLIDMLKMAETGDKKALHNANKAFDELVHEARCIKKKRNEDIQKAQEVIHLWMKSLRFAMSTEKARRNDFECVGENPYVNG